MVWIKCGTLGSLIHWFASPEIQNKNNAVKCCLPHSSSLLVFWKGNKKCASYSSILNFLFVRIFVCEPLRFSYRCHEFCSAIHTPVLWGWHLGGTVLWSVAGALSFAFSCFYCESSFWMRFPSPSLGWVLHYICLRSSLLLMWLLCSLLLSTTWCRWLLASVDSAFVLPDAFCFAFLRNDYLK